MARRVRCNASFVGSLHVRTLFKKIFKKSTYRTTFCTLAIFTLEWLYYKMALKLNHKINLYLNLLMQYLHVSKTCMG